MGRIRTEGLRDQPLCTYDITWGDVSHFLGLSWEGTQNEIHIKQPSEDGHVTHALQYKHTAHHPRKSNCDDPPVKVMEALLIHIEGGIISHYDAMSIEVHSDNTVSNRHST